MVVRSISDEPRNKKQAYNGRQALSEISSAQKDEMRELQRLLRSHQEEGNKGFLRDMTVTDSPYAFLALKINWTTWYVSAPAPHAFQYLELMLHLNWETFL